MFHKLIPSALRQEVEVEEEIKRRENIRRKIRLQRYHTESYIKSATITKVKPFSLYDEMLKEEQNNRLKHEEYNPNKYNTNEDKEGFNCRKSNNVKNNTCTAQKSKSGILKEAKQYRTNDFLLEQPYTNNKVETLIEAKGGNFMGSYNDQKTFNDISNVKGGGIKNGVVRSEQINIARENKSDSKQLLFEVIRRYMNNTRNEANTLNVHTYSSFDQNYRAEKLREIDVVNMENRNYGKKSTLMPKTLNSKIIEDKVESEQKVKRNINMQSFALNRRLLKNTLHDSSKELRRVKKVPLRDSKLPRKDTDSIRITQRNYDTWSELGKSIAEMKEKIKEKLNKTKRANMRDLCSTSRQPIKGIKINNILRSNKKAKKNLKINSSKSKFVAERDKCIKSKRIAENSSKKKRPNSVKKRNTKLL